MSDILKVRDFLRVRLTRNGTNLVDLAPSTIDQDYTKFVSERAVLSTNMATSQAATLGGITTAGRLMLLTDKSIQIGIGVTPANKVTLKDDGVFMITASFSHLWIKNTGTQEARIEYLATD